MRFSRADTRLLRPGATWGQNFLQIAKVTFEVDLSSRRTELKSEETGAMSCYLSSNNERYYAALESAYGHSADVTAQNRIPLLKLGAKQIPVSDRAER